MKKFILLICVCFLFSGCGKMMNTPTKQVEMFLAKYQTLDPEVLSDLDKTIAEEVNFNTDQRTTYKNLMKKHYQGLVYDVKDEEVNGDNATVKVEIEVTDYSKALAKAEQELQDNPDNFNDENGNYSVFLYTEHRLKLLKESKERVKYTLDLTLTKVDGKWRLNALSDTDESKLNGTYAY